MNARELARAADAAARQGRLDEAARLWGQVLSFEPGNAQALHFVGQHALHRGDAASAQRLLLRAGSLLPGDPMVWLGLATANRQLNDSSGEMAALDRALVADPYCYPALLAKGSLFQRMGETRSAARIFRDAIKIVLADDLLPQNLRLSVAEARESIRRNAEELEKFLEPRLKPERANRSGHDMDRFDECARIAAGTAKRYVQEPSLLYYPRLPAVAFHDRNDFPWLGHLEAATATIRRELLGLLEDPGAGFEPYVAHPPGAPVDQWADLNHSLRWSAYHLWRDGTRNEHECERCPRTAALLDELPMIRIPNFGPTVLFSVLAPHTHIPPHSSVTNARLVVHLPLIVPPGCRFRVGSETREWKEGEAWVFDDTFNHEAWNDSDRPRVILMIDVWNIHLSERERALVSLLLNGLRDYYAV